MHSGARQASFSIASSPLRFACSGGGLLDDAAPDREAHQIPDAVEVELLHKAAPVCVDRINAEL
jgi:hypothetical protein